jgi:sorting nexin-7/30/sorting nexin-8
MILTAEEIAISIPSYERVPGGMFTSAYYSYTVITDPIDWKV